jgi:hypothetical protein
VPFGCVVYETRRNRKSSSPVKLMGDDAGLLTRPEMPQIARDARDAALRMSTRAQWFCGWDGLLFELRPLAVGGWVDKGR